MTAGATGSDPAELLDLATRLARESGQLLVERSRHRLDRLALVDTARRKSSATDLGTEADRASEQLIVGAIKKARPTDAVLGEEGSEHGGTWTHLDHRPDRRHDELRLRLRDLGRVDRRRRR